MSSGNPNPVPAGMDARAVSFTARRRRRDFAFHDLLTTSTPDGRQTV